MRFVTTIDLLQMRIYLILIQTDLTTSCFKNRIVYCMVTFKSLIKTITKNTTFLTEDVMQYRV